MKFAIRDRASSPLCGRIKDAIVAELERRGHQPGPLDAETRFVLNLTSTAAPTAFRRHAQSLFVASLANLDQAESNIRSKSYATLVRTLSNVVLTVQPPAGGQAPEIHFTTPEAGFYHYPFDPAKVCDHLIPIVGARLMIKNRLIANLPERCWQTTPVVEKIKDYAGELDRMGLLPAPFPLADLLPPAEIDHLFHVCEVTGLSYGNLSARESIPELGPDTFWITARGVDKSRLTTIGRDLLLVTGQDARTREILVSVPPAHHPRARASVDAIEHCLIYQTFPEVGAIVHVHGWMEGAMMTRLNYPCGTLDVAREVAARIADTPDPSRATVGLKNHGLTLTGKNLKEILDRVRGRLRREVPMWD